MKKPLFIELYSDLWIQFHFRVLPQNETNTGACNDSTFVLINIPPSHQVTLHTYARIPIYILRAREVRRLFSAGCKLPRAVSEP